MEGVSVVDIAQEIGVKIRHYRKKKGMTVEQLADAAVCLGRSAALRERLKEGLTVIASGNRVERIVQAMTCRQKSPDLPNGENLV